MNFKGVLAALFLFVCLIAGMYGLGQAHFSPPNPWQNFFVGAGGTPVSACGTLSSANTYYTLSQSISASGATCITIGANNITLDCQGIYSITGDNSSGHYGVYDSSYVNGIVENCNISNFATDIYLSGGNGTVLNTSASSTGSSAGDAIIIIGVNITISNSFFNGTANYPTALEGPYATLVNSTFAGGSTGPMIWSTTNGYSEVLNNDTFTGGSYSVVDLATDYNSIVENCNMSQQFDFYRGAGVTSYNVTFMNNRMLSLVSDTSSPFHPIYNSTFANNSLTYAQFGSYFYNNTFANSTIAATAGTTAITLTNGTGNRFLHNSITASTGTSHGIYIDVNGANNTVDCQGASITGTNTTGTYGVYSSQFNTTIQNCNISNFATGIYFNGANNSILQNSTVATSFTGSTTNGNGVLLQSANYNSIINDSISTGANGLWGIYFYSTASNWNNITNSTIYPNIGMYGSSSNNIINGVSISNSISGDQAIYLQTANANISILNSNLTSTTTRALQMVSSTNATVANCIISGHDSSNGALWIDSGANNNNIANNTINGLALARALTINTGTNKGNIFYNNTILNATTTLLYIDAGGSNNTFYDNNFTATSGAYITDLNGSNYYNSSTDGNIYPDIVNLSLLATGTVASNIPHYFIASAGNTTVNITNLAKFSCNFAGCGDFKPLTPWYPESACGTLSTAGTSYLLSQSVSVSGATCFTISGANIALNCYGYSITGDNTSGHYGIEPTTSNANIQNCVINNFSTGVFVPAAASLTQINNVTVNQTYATSCTSSPYCSAVIFYQSNNNEISNSALYSAGAGLATTYTYSNNNVTNTTIVNGGAGGNGGIYEYDQHADNFMNDTITSATGYGIQAALGSNNTIDCKGATLSGANASSQYALYSTDFNLTAQNCNINSFEDGIRLSGATNNTYSNIKITGGSVSDNLVRITTGSNYNTFNNVSMTYAGTTGTSIGGYYNENGNYNTVNCQGATMIGDNASSTIGFYSTTTGDIIENCNLSNWGQDAIFFGASAVGSTVNNVTIWNMTYAGDYGVLINGASINGITVENSNIQNSGGYAVRAWSTPTNITIYNVTGTVLNAYNAPALGITTATNSQIINCTGNTTAGNYGLYVSAGTNINITNSTGISTSGRGIDVEGGSTGIDLIGNTAYTYTGGEGVHVEASSGTIVDNTTVHGGMTSGSNYGVHVTSGSNNTQIQNISVSFGSGTGTYGVDVDGGANVSVDCLRGNIVGTNATATYGIYSNQFNTTVKNCNISNFATGIYFSGANNGTISNTTSATTFAGSGNYGDGLLMTSSSYNTATNSVFNAAANGEWGAYLNSGDNSNTFTNISDLLGFGLYSASNGNTFNNITSNGEISGGIAFHITGSSNNSVLNSNLTAISTRAADIAVGGNNTYANDYISGASSTYGALYLTSATNSTIANNTINGLNGTNGYGISISVGASETGNVIYNNTFINAPKAEAYLDGGASANTLYDNNFTGNPTYFVLDLNGSNYYNTTEGNIYANVYNGTVRISGLTYSVGYPVLYIGNIGGGYPYNNVTSLGKFSCNFNGCADYAPITPFATGNVWISQSPMTVNSTNVYPNYFNVEYNITYINGTNSTITYWAKTNSTTSNVFVYGNGTAISGFMAYNASSIGNSGTTANFTLDDNDIYPATFNLPDNDFEGVVHNDTTLGSTSSFYATQILNVSNSTQYGVYEQMYNATRSTALSVIYCNSSYAFNDNPTTDANCVVFASVVANGAYNNCIDQPTNDSCHFVSTFAVNTTTGTVGGSTVKVSPISWFMIKDNGPGASQTVNIYQISTVTRTGATRLSTNSGSTWTDQSATTDAHLHQFPTNTTFYEYACDNVTTGCSATIQNLIGLDEIAPLPPIVTAPIDKEYTGMVNITWLPALSPGGAAISYYNVTLWSINGTQLAVLNGNVSTNLSYYWNSTSYPLGDYQIGVTAYDNQSQSATGMSVEFDLVNCGNISSSIDSDDTVFTLPSNVSTNGATCYNIQRSNTTINCNGFSITGNNTSGTYGVYSNSSQSTVANCTIINFGTDIDYDGNSMSGLIVNNTLESPSNTLLQISSGSGNNTIYWNNFTNTTGLYINDSNGSNFYNTTEGNVYANVINGSVSINGLSASTGYPSLYIGNDGTAYPYNNSTSVGKFSCNFANCVDNDPLTNQASTKVLTFAISAPSTVDKYHMGTLPASCVQPINQTAAVGIYNITNTGNSHINVVGAVSAVIPDFNISLSNTSACSNGLNLTASNQTLYTYLGIGKSIYLWGFAYADANLSTLPRFNISVNAQ